MSDNAPTNWMSTTGRIVFGIPFLMFGFFHFMNLEMMASMTPVPPAKFWVVFLGICLIAAAITLFVGRLLWLSMPLLAILMVVFAVALHVPEAMNPDTQMQGMMAILRNIGFAGGALFIAGVYPRPR